MSDAQEEGYDEGAQFSVPFALSMLEVCACMAKRSRVKALQQLILPSYAMLATHLSNRLLIRT